MTDTPAETPILNTDRELWREQPDDFYAASLHVTQDGGIGIDVDGSVIVKPIRKWHRLAALEGGATPTPVTPSDREPTCRCSTAREHYESDKCPALGFRANPPGAGDTQETTPTEADMPSAGDPGVCKLCGASRKNQGLCPCEAAGVESVMLIRCMKHRSVPQMDYSASGGAECAACVSEQQWTATSTCDCHGLRECPSGPCPMDEVMDRNEAKSAALSAPGDEPPLTLREKQALRVFADQAEREAGDEPPRSQERDDDASRDAPEGVLDNSASSVSGGVDGPGVAPTLQAQAEEALRVVIEEAIRDWWGVSPDRLIEHIVAGYRAKEQEKDDG